MKHAAIMTVMILSLALSCTVFEPASPQLVDLLPRETDAPGWLMGGRESIAAGDIKKENRLYAIFGAEGYAREVFHSISDQSVTTLVEIVKFPTSFHCFGLFSFERGFDTVFFESAENYYITQKGMFIWKGDYYIKITSSAGTMSMVKGYSVFGSAVSGAIGSMAKEIKLPSYVYTFSDNYSTGDLVYYIQGHRLLPGSEKIFVRKKIVFDEPSYVFFSRYDSPASASEIYGRMLGVADPGYIVTKEGNLQMNFRQGDGERLVFMAVYKDYIFGVLNAADPSKGQRIMARLYAEISGYYK